jgi:hypothetical protein
MYSSNSAYLCQRFDLDIPNIRFLPKLGVVSKTKSQLPRESESQYIKGF